MTSHSTLAGWDQSRWLFATLLTAGWVTPRARRASQKKQTTAQISERMVEKKKKRWQRTWESVSRVDCLRGDHVARRRASEELSTSSRRGELIRGYSGWRFSWLIWVSVFPWGPICWLKNNALSSPQLLKPTKCSSMFSSKFVVLNPTEVEG